MQGEPKEAVPWALLFHECGIMRARPTQQFYYARRVCVPWVIAAQIMRDIKRDNNYFAFYYARNVARGRNERVRNERWVIPVARFWYPELCTKILVLSSRYQNVLIMVPIPESCYHNLV